MEDFDVVKTGLNQIKISDGHKNYTFEFTGYLAQHYEALQLAITNAVFEGMMKWADERHYQLKENLKLRNTLIQILGITNDQNIINEIRKVISY